MAEDIRILLREADALAALADEVTATFARQLAVVLRALERELPGLIGKAQAGTVTALLRAARVAQTRKEIRALLDAAGYDALVEHSTDAVFDRLLAGIARVRMAADVAAFTTSDLTRIQALKRLSTLDLLDAGDDTARALWRVLARQVLGGQRTSLRLLQGVTQALDGEERHVRTLYDTTASVYMRQVEALKSDQSPAAPYLYVGPVGGPIRPFCLARVGKVYSRGAIADMSNGQLPDVLLTGGGYNCRHTWVAVSALSDTAKLVDTNQRLPEVEADIEELARKKAA